VGGFLGKLVVNMKEKFGPILGRKKTKKTEEKKKQRGQ